MAFTLEPNYFEIKGNESSLEPIHTRLPKVQQDALKELDHYPKFYTSCLKDLSIQQSKLTRTECSYAMGTILAIAILEKNATELSRLVNEYQRNLKITELTGIGAEPELTSGKNPDEIYSSIMFRVNEVKETYIADAKKNDTWSFFQLGFLGPPCFNGRINTLEEYIAEKHQEKPRSIVSDKTPYDKEALEFCELMYEYNDSHTPKIDDLPEQDSFFIYLKSMDEYASLSKETYIKIYQRASQLYVKVNE